jgi:guanylate kinase
MVFTSLETTMLKFDRPTLLTITAPTCSGKNYLLEALEARLGFTRIVSTTTRPIRPGELNGHDYYFITDEASRRMEHDGVFAELIEFRGVRYGVTHTEMATKMTGAAVPMVILEPQGLAVYKKICVQNNWDVYTVYVSTVESERIRRLAQRTTGEALLTNGDKTKMNKVIGTHTDRLLSITGEERQWSNTTIWDAIVPGDDIEKALEYIERGVTYRNQRVAAPTAYVHVAP